MDLRAAGPATEERGEDIALEDVFHLVEQQDAFLRSGYEALRKLQSAGALSSSRCLTVFVGFTDSVQRLADLSGQNLAELSFAGARRTIEQEIDALMAPGGRPLQNACRKLVQLS